jgi:hypothetical protein
MELLSVRDQEPGRTVGDEFVDSLAGGQSPATTAQRLGIPVTIARKWTHRLTQLARDLGRLNGLRPREIYKRPLLTGITLVHVADLFEASPSQRITFTTWVMNDTDETLSEILLVPRSFTNAGLEDLNYAMEPPAPEMRLETLQPGETASWTFTYVVTERDVSHGGILVSAMGVQARNPAAATLWDECDAEVVLTPANPTHSC